MALSPQKFAEKVARWAKVGFSYVAIQGGRQALDVDRKESQDRAPKLHGALARTIRVSSPSLARAAKKGTVRLALSAGSSSKGHPVIYASVHQRGLVGWPGKPATEPHRIAAQRADWVVRRIRGRYSATQGSKKVLSFVMFGERMAREFVNHPGSRFKARNYLRVNESRAAQTLERAVARSASGDFEFPMAPAGGWDR